MYANDKIMLVNTSNRDIKKNEYSQKLCLYKTVQYHMKLYIRIRVDRRQLRGSVVVSTNLQQFWGLA